MRLVGGRLVEGVIEREGDEEQQAQIRRNETEADGDQVAKGPGADRQRRCRHAAPSS